MNFTSVETLRTLHIAWLHRKVLVEDFRTQYAFSTEVKFTVNASRAGERFSVSTASLVTSISPCYC